MRLRLLFRDFEFSRATKNAGLSFCFALVVFMLVQMGLYGRYAFEATQIYIRQAVGQSGVHDQKKIGAICNSIGRLKCSKRQFTKVLQNNPADREALSNLAMSLTMLGEATQAEPYFRAYFADGGQALDAMHWYAKALHSLGRDSEAITWYYNVLSARPDLVEVASTLLSLLKQQKRHTEAHSVLAALLSQSNDEEHVSKWREMLAQLPQVDEEREVQIPALDGRRFYIPISTAHSAYRFVASIEDQVSTQLSYSDAMELGLDEKKIKTGKVYLSKLNIGPFELQNIEIEICHACRSVLGAKLLSHLGASIDDRGRVPYLMLRQRER